MLAAARAPFDATELAMDPDETPECEKGLVAIRDAMDATEFPATRADGKGMGLDDAVAFALGRK